MKIKFNESDAPKILAALYNNSKPPGMGMLQYDPTPMTTDEAINLLNVTPYFDYIKGRVMKINLGKDTVGLGLYDRDNGLGSGALALAKAGIDFQEIDPEEA